MHIAYKPNAVCGEGNGRPQMHRSHSNKQSIPHRYRYRFSMSIVVRSKTRSHWCTLFSVACENCWVYKNCAYLEKTSAFGWKVSATAADAMETKKLCKGEPMAIRRSNLTTDFMGLRAQTRYTYAHIHTLTFQIGTSETENKMSTELYFPLLLFPTDLWRFMPFEGSEKCGKFVLSQLEVFDWVTSGFKCTFFWGQSPILIFTMAAEESHSFSRKMCTEKLIPKCIGDYNSKWMIFQIVSW